MLIDSSSYLGSWPYWRVDVKTADQLSRSLKTNGVDKALVASLRSIYFDAEEGNKELLRAVESHPKRLYGLATLTPLFKKKGTGCKALRDGTFRGIRLYPQNHAYDLGYAGRVFDLAEELDVPIVLPHRVVMSWAMPEIPLQTCISVAKAYPRVTFVLSCFNYDALGAVLTHQFPKNMLAETSGLQVVDGVELIVGALGEDKVMLGTGQPVQIPQAGIQKVLHAKLKRKQMEAVTWKNAARTFGID